MCQRIEQPLSLEDWVEKYGAKPKQWRVGGMPNYQGGNTNRGRPVTKETILDRCILEPESECWIWMGRKTKDGYGKIKEMGKTVRTHRKAFELWKGEIPSDKCVLHDCPGGDNPACCNPSHLRLGTKRENRLDLCIKGKSHKTSCMSSLLTRLFPKAQSPEIMSLDLLAHG